MKKRFKDPSIVDAVLEADVKWRDLTAEIKSMKTELNKLQKEVIAPKKKAKEDCAKELEMASSIKADISNKEKVSFHQNFAASCVVDAVARCIH